MDGPSADPATAWVAAMRAQDFAAAWRIADAVLSARDPTTRDDPALPYHQRWVWDGTPPDDRHVLVRCYHGLGDTLQFARFLPALRRRAARVTLDIQPELLGLLAAMPGVDRLHPFDQAAPLPHSPCDMEIMELGHVLRADAAATAACVPYIAAPSGDAGRVAAKRGVGLCWQAGDWDAARSVPLPDLVEACVAPGRRFISLQRGPASAQATHPAFINPRDHDTDIRRTAALIAASRCVVTVDTAVAHLAGAMGRPTVVLLRTEADWRWPCAGAGSAWYPSVTLLHQDRPGDWTGALARLSRLLDDSAGTMPLRHPP